MRRFGLGALASCLLLAALLVSQGNAVHGATAYADPQFQQQWQQGEALTPNFWGPVSTAKDGQQESYVEAGGQRLVQYFDKGRMELTNGSVTNGLLASEIVKGQVQVGDATFQAKASPAIPIAGDNDNPGPTYAQLGNSAASLLAPATSSVGSQVTASVAADGTVGANGTTTGNTNIAAFDDATQHNVPGVFADYRAKAGLQTIGLAISEPFLASVKVAGAQKIVLIQIFERRVLTFTASNDAAFQVEMGNIGQHYVQWRYTGAPIASTATVAQTALPADPLPRTATTAPPTSSASAGSPLLTGETGPGAPARKPLPSLPTNLPQPATSIYVPPTNLTCASFPNQATAQEFLRLFPTDPSHLDPNKAGIACAGNPAPTDLTPVKRP